MATGHQCVQKYFRNCSLNVASWTTPTRVPKTINSSNHRCYECSFSSLKRLRLLRADGKLSVSFDWLRANNSFHGRSIESYSNANSAFLCRKHICKMQYSLIINCAVVNHQLYIKFYRGNSLLNHILSLDPLNFNIS